jgi:transcriptional regulator with XRE-family HTH domain
MRTNRETVANELRRRMKFGGWSATRLSQAIGRGDTFIKEYINGKKKRDMAAMDLAKICEQLGCTADDLFYPDHKIDQEMIRVGSNLALFILSLGKTFDEVSREFGVKPGALGSQFGGFGYPSIRFLIPFCAKYGCSIDWLFHHVSDGEISSSCRQRKGRYQTAKITDDPAP